MEKKKKKISNNSVTREKLDNMPFQKASELKKAQDDLRYQMWKRLENAKLFHEMSQKKEYKFIKDEFVHGLSCKYQNQGEDLVKIFSEGKGIKIDINKKLVKAIPQSQEFVGTLIRSMGDTFSKSYYQVKGIMPPDSSQLDEMIDKLKDLLKK